ncbi:hypothetical protein D6833_13930 [Candidatus Parcubacteria bacterium]|nr:MAG: hypothetical protein D6833_13930 [Candidatus Parcubacteria bacterium]
MDIYRHKCGQRVVVASRWNGLVYVTVFLDLASGKELTHCPTCGESVIAWLYLPEGGEALRLRPDVLIEEGE